MLGFVVIGRNEGQRLVACLDALLRAGCDAAAIVYVDSGSSDGSVDVARARGIDALVLTAPFTAAKGRNTGFLHLRSKHPALDAIQFIDGDCEYFPAYFDVAHRALMGDASLIAVTGVLHERAPEASVWNLLADVEWTGAFGDLDAFGGNVMIKRAALDQGGLYNEGLIAGEDPELAVRLKKATGGRVVRIDEPMCLHDLAMTQARQWWKRNVRSGHAYAEVSRMHGDEPPFFWRKEVRSNWLWGVLPVAAPALAVPGYLVLFWRIYGDARRRGLDAKTARIFALFTAIGKVPQALGQAKYEVNRRRGVRATIMEYKKPSS